MIYNSILSVNLNLDYFYRGFYCRFSKNKVAEFVNKKIYVKFFELDINLPRKYIENIIFVLLR